MIKSYPKILPLVGKYADLILGHEIQVEEKVDGSLFAFGLDMEGKLHCRSKGTAISIEAPNDLFRPAVEHVVSVQERLPKGTIFYGETLKTNRHNTLCYDRIPKNHIALFGMFDWERTSGSSYASLVSAAELLDVDVVPRITSSSSSGNYVFKSLSEVEELLDRESFLGGQKIEGVVLKDYSRPMEFAGMIYPLTVLKLVSEQFKEKHAGNPDWTPQKDVLEECLSRYKTEARWHKTVQHLRDDGKLTGEPKDIGPLMKALWEDVVTEEKENFKEELFHIFKKRLAHKVQAGFPEWFKRQLLTGDFNVPQAA
jgi:hypothetical protein